MAEQKKLEVPLDEEEMKDLEEFCRHHPEIKNPAEALKKMAGLKTYRMLKEKTDKDRKKPSVILVPQDWGIPMFIPCALQEQLDSIGMTCEEFINKSLLAGIGEIKIEKIEKVEKKKEEST